jgi:hypothetical protein
MTSHSADRLALNPQACINAALKAQAERRFAYFVAHPERVEARLRELDQECALERLLKNKTQNLTLHGFHLLPHVFRRMGYRTQKEIAAERRALKAIRGDFRPRATPC